MSERVPNPMASVFIERLERIEIEKKRIPKFHGVCLAGLRDLLDARAQEESWKILANRANERADQFERELDETRRALRWTAHALADSPGPEMPPDIQAAYAAARAAGKEDR